MISKEFLSKIPIFEKLSPGDHDTLVTLWQKRLLTQGQVLFRKGETGNSMFVIEKGVIEITVPTELQKKETRISVLHEGEFLGELSLVDGLPRTATATAMEECELLEMKREDFMTFLMQRPAVAIAMVSEIGKRLRATNEQVMSLASKNLNVEIEETLSFGDRVADKVAEFGGSWKFIFTFLTFMAIWMSLNMAQLWFKPFDDYPFILLNLMLSTVAALQGPVIMMSQNRAGKKDRLQAELDYNVNLKSELMLQQLHTKFDEMRATELQTIQEVLERNLGILQRRIQEAEKDQSRLELLDENLHKKGRSR
ncbi:MAG: DUF1003 domain-containing protein [Ignavibacteriales bacterium]|nr:DUF1003 domain-containing protein [Ignavibacteriales bacterium]